MSNLLVVVGPGRLGLALSEALMQARVFGRLIFMGRAAGPPPHALFQGIAEYQAGLRPPPRETSALILAVPDHAIGQVAEELARDDPFPRSGAVAVHLAGALPSDALEPLRIRGFATGSLHPLQSIADLESGADRLQGAAFAVDGDATAVETARDWVAALGGLVLFVPAEMRPLYHAAAAIGSNYLVVLCAFAAQLLQRAGIPDEKAMPALIPLLRSTLDNVERLGVTTALTGPIARGDAETVRLHLSRLSTAERALYCALGREALRLARLAGLEDALCFELESLLNTE